MPPPPATIIIQPPVAPVIVVSPPGAAAGAPGDPDGLGPCPAPNRRTRDLFSEDPPDALDLDNVTASPFDVRDVAAASGLRLLLTNRARARCNEPY